MSFGRRNKCNSEFSDSLDGTRSDAGSGSKRLEETAVMESSELKKLYR
jgi:hypothetical protein